ncbi:MAG: hypothetical protein NTY64_23175 [Deltaproteobacteria bacterium]|nr:hypothetical protein [Deltaproteobacteria bacterium]
MDIYSEHWNLEKGIDSEGRIFDKNWKSEDRIEDGRIYDENFNLLGRIERNRFFR